MDGTLINKSGIISGGVYAGLEARAQKWDRQTLENMKQVRGVERVPGAVPCCHEWEEGCGPVHGGPVSG